MLPETGADRFAAEPHTLLCAALRSNCDLALVLLDFLELSVDHVVFRLARATGRGTARCCTRGTGRCACCTLRSLHVGVHLFAELLRRRCDHFNLGFDRRLVAPSNLASIAALSLEPLFSVSSRSFSAASIFSFSAASSLSPYSVSAFFVLWTSASPWLRASASSRSL